jgi:hypothetical protein
MFTNLFFFNQKNDVGAPNIQINRQKIARNVQLAVTWTRKKADEVSKVPRELRVIIDVAVRGQLFVSLIGFRIIAHLCFSRQQ